MKFSIVHLSDLHLKAKANYITQKIDNLVNAINSQLLEIDCIFIVVTGDIANTGNNNEYEEAGVVFNKLLSGLNSLDTPVHFVFVPGNHDVNFNNNKNKLRQIVIENIKANKTNIEDDSLVNQCCEFQNEYRLLEKEFISDKNIRYADNLLNILIFESNGKLVKFNCLNTSWCSEIKEKQGTLYYPMASKISQISKYPADLTISIMHHSPVWFESENIRQIHNSIDKHSDIILSGHEHVSSKSIIDKLDGDKIEHLEGSILQDNSDESISGFNHILVDLENKCQKIFNYEWNGEIYSLGEIPSDKWIPLTHIRENSRNPFFRDEKFELFINDPGANFIHKKKQNLSLKDFFVYPHLKNIKIQSLDNDDTIIEKIDSSILKNIEGDENKSLVIGSEKSGKTALCKMLFRYFNSLGRIPVWIDGNRIKNFNTERFNKLVEKCFSEQYSKNNKEKFVQTPNKQKILIIEDLHKSKLNYEQKGRLLTNINKYYSNIIITANELFQIGELVSEKCDDAFDNYQQYEIQPFGHFLRAKLIEKWNKIEEDQAEQGAEPRESIRKQDRDIRIVNTIVGDNYVPSYPIFVVIILQGVDAGTPNKLTESSYGYYYEYLITGSLGRIENISHEDIDKFYNYLTELSYYLFNNRVSEISESDFRKFNDFFCNEYKINIPFEPNCDQLLKTRIIVKYNETYKFNYKYSFYFFIARYLANNLTEGHIKDVISAMCLRLYNESNSNIIMFLTHHSKDPFIINELVKNSKSLFEKFDPAELDKDASIVNKLLDDIPNLVLENIDVKKEREERFIAQDDFEDTTSNNDTSEDKFDTDDDLVELDMITQLNLAFRSIEILGQILKNYYASMKGDVKYSVCEESYFVLLRSLSSFFEMLNENSEYLVCEIESILEKNKSVQSYKVTEASKTLIFNVMNMIIYAFIKKLSSSVGSKNLSVIYEEILKNNNTNAINLIDIAIKLDFSKYFPVSDLKRLVDDFSGNPLATLLLKQFVIDHLYMFITSDGEKQTICNLLDIPIKNQRVIDYAGRQ